MHFRALRGGRWNLRGTRTSCDRPSSAVPATRRSRDLRKSPPISGTRADAFRLPVPFPPGSAVLQLPARRLVRHPLVRTCLGDLKSLVPWALTLCVPDHLFSEQRDSNSRESPHCEVVGCVSFRSVFWARFHLGS